MHTQRWRKYFSREQFFDMWCLLCKNSFVQLLFRAVQMISFFFKYVSCLSVRAAFVEALTSLLWTHTHAHVSAPHTPSPPTPPVVLWRLAISVQLEQCGRSVFFKRGGSYDCVRRVWFTPDVVIFAPVCHASSLPAPFDHFSTVLPPPPFVC